jgi:cyclin B
MKNPSAKKVNNSIYSGIDKRSININNDFLRNQLNKIIFKKGSGDKDKNLKFHKAKNNNNFYFKNLQTRNQTNSTNDSKYISIRSNNLETIDKINDNDKKDYYKKGKNILTQNNIPNILLFEQGNMPTNEQKLALVNRAITQPLERNEIIGYKSCGKNNFDKPKNFSLKNNFLNGGFLYLNQNISNNTNNEIPKSISKSPKRNHSSNVHRKNPELVSRMEIMQKNQEKQYFKLREFYQKENELNQKYSLFDFPEIKYGQNSSKTNLNNIKGKNAQIPYEYFNEYLETYCREEKTLEFRIKPNFMKYQQEINCRMRAIIVNWIIEVHDRFKLLPDTLFLSIIIFDRYMSIINNIDKNRLQLIGVTSLLIACKYEEIFSPEVRDFICILDRQYEREDLMEEENNILKILKFEVMYPSALRYYEILRIKFGIEERYYKYGNFLLELCLLDCKFSKYLQAIIATTICFIILKLFQKVSFEKFMNYNIRVKEKEIMECLVDICFMVEFIDSSIYPAINKKYKGVCNEIKKIIEKENKLKIQIN